MCPLVPKPCPQSALLKPSPAAVPVTALLAHLQRRVHEARVAQVGETADARLALVLLLLPRPVAPVVGEELSAGGLLRAGECARGLHGSAHCGTRAGPDTPRAYAMRVCWLGQVPSLLRVSMTTTWLEEEREKGKADGHLALAFQSEPCWGAPGPPHPDLPRLDVSVAQGDTCVTQPLKGALCVFDPKPRLFLGAHHELVLSGSQNSVCTERSDTFEVTLGSWITNPSWPQPPPPPHRPWP